jgi:hypothetical protein
VFDFMSAGVRAWMCGSPKVGPISKHREFAHAYKSAGKHANADRPAAKRRKAHQGKGGEKKVAFSFGFRASTCYSGIVIALELCVCRDPQSSK